MPDKNLLECFENPAPEHEYVIEHIAEEFTSLCPKTGTPDFGSIIVRYSPARLCVELKSLKLYYQGFRNEGIFYEAVTNCICTDLNDVMRPRWMVIETHWKGRGGIRSTIRASAGDVPT